MESITITVKNEEKARMLSELLQALDFVTEVKLNRIGQPQASEENGEKAVFLLWLESGRVVKLN
ncbi:MAG: hypothetical protein KJ069_25475 [Anaerolineae bacterium]|nr:hypothetical protein [Anaerolineae bacterium]